MVIRLMKVKEEGKPLKTALHSLEKGGAWAMCARRSGAGLQSVSTLPHYKMPVMKGEL